MLVRQHVHNARNAGHAHYSDLALGADQTFQFKSALNE